MNSVGIPEGTSYKEEYCTCRWMSTAAIPSTTTLIEKCDACKRKEKEQGISPVEKAGTDNLNAIIEKAKGLVKSGTDKKNLERIAQQMKEDSRDG